MPESVASIDVSVTDSSGSEVFSGTLARIEAGSPLFSAEKLGMRPARLIVKFRSDDGTALSTVERSMHFAGARIDELRDRIKAVREKVEELVAGRTPVAPRNVPLVTNHR